MTNHACLKTNNKNRNNKSAIQHTLPPLEWRMQLKRNWNCWSTEVCDMIQAITDNIWCLPWLKIAENVKRCIINIRPSSWKVCVLCVPGAIMERTFKTNSVLLRMSDSWNSVGWLYDVYIHTSLMTRKKALKQEVRNTRGWGVSLYVYQKLGMDRRLKEHEISILEKK